MKFGPIARMLYESFPVLAPEIDRLWVEEIALDKELGSSSTELPPYELLSMFRTDVLEPALSGPIDGVDLRSCCDFVVKVLELDRKADGHYRTALLIRVFDRLSAQDGKRLLEAEPRIASLVKLG